MSRYLRHLPPLETLVTFEAVGRNGSFTRAATELFVTQSAVSKKMQSLESSLNVNLFERQSRGIALTPAGRELYGEVGAILERLHRAVSRIRTIHHANAVTIIATHAIAQFWLFPKLMEFNKVHPSIAVHIHAINEIDETSIADYDFGVLYGGGDWSSLDAKFVMPEVVYPVASPTINIDTIKTLEQLAEQTLIQLDASQWNCMDWNAWFDHFGLAYKSSDRDPVFNQLTLAYRAVQQGMGIGLAWNFMADEAVAKGELHRVGSFECVTGQGEYLVSVRQRQFSQAAALFHDWLLSTLC